MQKVFKSFAFLCVFFVFACLTACHSTNGAKEKPAAPATAKVEQKSNAAETEAQTQKIDQQIQNISTNQATEGKKPEQSTAPKEQASPTKQTSQSNAAVKTNTQTSPAKSTSTVSAAKSDTASTSTKQQTKTTTTTPATAAKSQQPVSTVTLTVIGPKDKGTIISASKVGIKNGDTVLAVLLHGAQNKGIDVDYRGSGAMAYVEGIDNIYEFDYGPKSGWTCKQNGVTIPRSAGAITVKQGDRIEWIYTEDYSENK